MFCTQCGKENQEGVSYCIYCGSKIFPTDRTADVHADQNDISQGMAGNSTLHTPDSYRKLGGWLAVISYGRLASAILELTACIAVVFTAACFKYYSNGNREFVGLANFFRAAASKGVIFETVLCYGGILMLFLYLFHACACIAMCRKIKRKKVNCMGFYRGVTALIFCVTMAGLVVGFYLVTHNSFSESLRFDMVRIMPIAGAAVCLLLDMIISLLVFNAYFKTSVRVKYYFGTKQ